MRILWSSEKTTTSKLDKFRYWQKSYSFYLYILSVFTLRYSCDGNVLGRCTVWCVPHCGGITIHRISFTCGLSGGLTPYRYPAIYEYNSKLLHIRIVLQCLIIWSIELTATPSVFEISFETSQTKPWFVGLDSPFLSLFQCKFVWQFFKSVSPKQLWPVIVWQTGFISNTLLSVTGRELKN